MMKQQGWRTTLCGLIGAAAAFMALYGPDIKADPRLIALGKFVAAGGIACLGVNAADKKDQGGNPQ